MNKLHDKLEKRKKKAQKRLTHSLREKTLEKRKAQTKKKQDIEIWRGLQLCTYEGDFNFVQPDMNHNQFAR